MKGHTAAHAMSEIELFAQKIDENRFDFCKLVYIIFPFGEVGHELEHMEPYDWQMEEWAALSAHLQNPMTRYDVYRLCISSGNGAAKTGWGAMTYLMLMYTQRVRGRITANTDGQMRSVVWPEYDLWFNRARFVDSFFEKFGTSIKARDEKLAETWRLDAVTWNEGTPAAISGLHNKGGAVVYIFEEAPGIPAIIWRYASGAFTETGTIKLWFAFGNSDDPESKFEQNMQSSLWRARRIDTRTLDHIDKKQIADWLQEAGGDEDDDDFRVRVRGLPRKSAKDSIIKIESVLAALERRKKFDVNSVKTLPAILAIDPAWQGGDETVIWYMQGNYKCLLEKYKLQKQSGETHQLTFSIAQRHCRDLRIDHVFVDQGEGTTLYTLAVNAGLSNWELVAFAGTPTDAVSEKESEYGNIRAMMYYHADKWLRQEGVIDSRDPAWIEDIKKQLIWTKGTRHKITGKKMCEAKLEIKNRVGQSPDVADGFVLPHARVILERLPENETSHDGERMRTGSGVYKMPEHSLDHLYGDPEDVGQLYS